MALEGDLQEFSAAEALGLIAREEKTGAIVVMTPDDERLVVHFEHGRVVQARDPSFEPEDDFVALLRELGVISDLEWKAVLSRSRERGATDPVEGLLAVGVGNRETFQEWLLTHTQGVMDRLLEMPSGSFCFEPRRTAFPFAVPLAEKTEFLVMEAGRRSDEARELLASELTPGAVPVLRPGNRPVPTDPFRARLLRLLDGNRSVADILAATAIPQYEILSLLRLLADRGFVAMRVRIGARRTQHTSRRSASAAARVAYGLGALVLVVASVFVGLKLWLRYLPIGP